MYICKLLSMVHHKNLQKLVIEIYKVANGLCHEILNETFQFQIQNHHNIRNSSTFRIPSFNDPKIWSQVPDKIKSLESLRSFKKGVKKWVPQMCQYRLCRTFLNGVVFVS